MRIPGRKIWRAFKELDQFSDEQCARFVRAATAFGWGAAFRGLFLFVAGASSLLGILWLVASLTYEWDRTFRPAWLAMPATMAVWTVGITLSPLLVLVLRDWLLLRRIRHLLRDRGVCSVCRYSLIGLPIGDELRVACPECGSITTVDASLGELGQDADGRRQFDPRPGGVNIPPPFWTPRRKRIGLRLAVASVVVLVGGPLLLWGCYEGFLRYQARAVRQSADARQTILNLLSDARSGADDGGQVWTAMRLSIGAWNNATNTRLERLEGVDRATILMSYLVPGPDLDADGVVPGTETLSNASKSSARTGREIMRATIRDPADVRAVLAPWAGIERASAPVYADLDPGSPMLGVDFVVSPKFRDVGLFVGMQAAIMSAAVKDGRWDDYAESLRQLRLLRDSIRLVPTGLHLYMESMVDEILIEQVRDDLMRAPHPRLLDIASVCARDEPSSKRLLDAVEMERLGQLDLLNWLFSDPSRVRRQRWSKAVDDLVNPQRMWGWGSRRIPGHLGFYWENVQAMNAAAADTVARSKVPSSARPFRGEDDSDLMLVKWLKPGVSGERLLSQWDKQLLAYRSLRVLIELQREFVATGRYPDSLDAVRSRLGPADLENPLLGGEIQYRLLPAIGERSITPSSDVQQQIVNALPFVLFAPRVAGLDAANGPTSDWIPLGHYFPGSYHQPLVILNIGRSGTARWWAQPAATPQSEVDPAASDTPAAAP